MFGRPCPRNAQGDMSLPPLSDRRLRRAPQSNVGSSFVIGGFLIWTYALCDLSTSSRAGLSRSSDPSGVAKVDRKESYDLRSHNSHILRLQNGYITGLQNGHILRLQHAFCYALQNDHILRSEHGHIPRLQALPRSEMRRPIELIRDPSRPRAILHLR